MFYAIYVKLNNRTDWHYYTGVSGEDARSRAEDRASAIGKSYRRDFPEALSAVVPYPSASEIESYRIPGVALRAGYNDAAQDGEAGQSTPTMPEPSVPVSTNIKRLKGGG